MTTEEIEERIQLLKNLLDDPDDHISRKILILMDLKDAKDGSDTSNEEE